VGGFGPASARRAHRHRRKVGRLGQQVLEIEPVVTFADEFGESIIDVGRGREEEEAQRSILFTS